jgi:curli biogenesis system outer membrane secretion channel CsgG
MRTCHFLPTVLAVALVAGCADVPASAPAVVNGDASARALAALPALKGDRVSVAIYEFRSTVTEIPARGSTDLFTTALVRSGQFRVIERARINEGVVREKQMNASGLTKGDNATQLLTGARYIFEGAITEANTSETARNGGITVAGMQVGGGRNRDVIGIDVRIVDAATGEILDVVTVRKPILGDAFNVSGVGNLVATAMAAKGRNTAFVPDVQYDQQRKQSLDVALRDAIDQAVVTLAQRLSH